jgi:hypothetical protein
MTIDEAIEIGSHTEGIFSTLNEPDGKVCLDDWFTADQLEAIAVLMRAAQEAGKV